MIRTSSVWTVLAAFVICGAPVPLNAQPTGTGSRPPSSQAERLAEISERDPASSADAPHIDWVTLREERQDGHVFIVQKIGYHSLKGNANNLHLQLISVSGPDARIRLRDHAIRAPRPRQQRGTFLIVRFDCERLDKSYSYVQRATIMDADSEHSNAVEFAVDCNLAFTS